MLKIYCDETWTSRSEYKNIKNPYIVFYGVMVDDSLETALVERINTFKTNRGLFPPGREFPAEVKWQKVEEEAKEAAKKKRRNRYEEFLDIFFESMSGKQLSFGYLFMDKREHDKIELDFLSQQDDNQHNFFFMLYYQFLYHCFIKSQVGQKPCEILIDNHDMGAEGQTYDIEKLRSILNRKIYLRASPKYQMPLLPTLRKELVDSVQLVSLAESKEYPLIQMADLCAGCVRYALENEIEIPLAKNQLSLFDIATEQEPISGRQAFVNYFYRKLRAIKGYDDINLLKVSYHHRFNIFPFSLKVSNSTPPNGVPS